ncbi:MAG: SUMO conjugating enzyme Hus5 [Marteilia pararefringens]
MTANSSSGGGETSKVGPKTRQSSSASSAASHQTPSTNNRRGAANASKKASSSQKTLKSTTLSTGGVKNSLCITRLQHERDQWPKDHPFGFTAKPYKESPTSFANIMIWECLIPGRPNVFLLFNIIFLNTFRDS